MANNLTLSVTLTGDGRQLSGTLKDAQGDVQAFGVTTEREGQRSERSLKNFGDTARAEGGKASQALRSTGNEVTTVSNHLNNMQRMAAAALTTLVGFVGIRGISNEWAEIRRESELLERNLFRQQQLIETTGRAAERSAQQMLEQSRALALTTLQSTEGVMQAQQTLMTFRNIRGEVFDQAIEGALDLAAAMGTDLNSTILQVAKALEDPITGMTALTRSGTVFTAAQREMVREMVETNRTAEAQGFILSELAAQYGGVAQAEAQGLAGAQDTLGQAMQEARLEIGEYLRVGERLSDFYNNTATTIFRFNDALASGDLDGHIRLMTTTATVVGAAAGAYAAYRAILVSATVAQWAFNAAVRANPLGIAITLLGAAAGAMYAYREEVTLAGKESYQTSIDVDGLTSSFHLLTEAQQENKRASLTADLIDMRVEAGRLGSELAEVARKVRNSGQLTPEGGALPIATPEDIKQGREIREELAKLLNNIEGGTKLLHQYDEAMEGLGQTTRDTNTRTRALAETNAAATKAADEVTKATAAQAAAIETLRNRLRPGRAEVVQLAQDQNTLNLAFAMGRITASEYLYMIGALQTAYIDAQNDADDLATSTTNALYTMDGAMEELRTNGLRRLDNGFADLWLGAVDGSRNATDTIKRMWDQTLAELLHMTITRPITVQLAASMGFGGQAAGGASSGGFGISPGSVGNMWQALQGGFNGIQWGGAGGAQAYGSGGWANAATQGTGATGYFGGSMQNFSGMQGLAGLGAGFAGNYLGGQLFGQGSQSNTLGAVGGVAGTYLGGPIGALLGSGLGSALGGLFGGRRWNETGSGVNLGVSDGDISGNQFSEQHSKGGLFRSSRRRTQTSSLDGEFSGALQEVYDATEASLAATIEVLGFQSSALTGFTTGLTRIDTQGLSTEDAEAKIQEWLSNTLNALAIHSVGDVSQYAIGGETTIETVERLAVALGSLNPILEQLHGSTLAASMAGGSAASHLAELAGGIDAFSARADFYYQNVLTETERQERAMAAAAQAIGAFTARTGQVINSTDALRDLVDGIDLTTASGRELYNEAMNLAPALVEIERGLERVGQRFDEMLRDAESALADAEAQARRAWQAFDSQQFDMQLELLALMGDSEGALALERERELATIDESLRPMRERIWAMQDEVTVQQNVTQAARNYQRELSRVRDQLSQQFANIGNWLDQQQAASGSPETNLATAQEQLARQLVLAENGDRNALQNITQYAQQVLDANREYNASSPAGQRIEQDVYDAIRALPESISAEEFLAGEIRDALQSVVISAMPTDERLAFELSRELTRLDTNQLTVSQVRSALSLIASDAEISRLIRQVDANGDGIITKQELANMRLTGLAGGIGSTLKPMFDSLDSNLDGLIDWNEFYGAFNGLASDQELKRIFQQLDKDGSGTISRLEALNRTSQGTELNTDSLEKQARDQLSELNGLVSEMARSTDQFVGLNSTMVSLRDSINALGVAQADIVRIEKERAAAEKAERDRVELSRKISAAEATVAGHLAEVDYRMGRRASFMESTRDHAGKVSKDVEDRVLNYIHENTSRADMTAAEREQMHSWMLRVFGDGSPEYLYALSRMGSFRNESLARDAQRQADQSALLLEQLRGQLTVNGSHATGLWNVPFDGYVAELHKDEMVVPATTAGRLRDLSDRSPSMGAMSLPSFPLLGNNDVLETLRDLKREVSELRRDNAQLQRESNKHLAAANNQRGAAAKGQIGAIERGNKMLKKLEDDKRLEAAKR